MNDVSDDSRFYGEVDGRTGFETRAILCAAELPGMRQSNLSFLMQSLGIC